MLVVDASVALKWVLKEPDSNALRDLWRSWVDAGEALIAPALFRAETLSVLRRNVYRGVLTAEEAENACAVLENLSVEVREPDELSAAAWRLAIRLNQPTVYDCCYLALADIMGCELWTADARFAGAASLHLPHVRLFAPSS